MHGLWLDDLETLEAISQDDDTRRLFLRMAQLSQDGRLKPFLRELAADGDLDHGDEVSAVASSPRTRASCTRSRTTSSAPGNGTSSSQSEWAILDSNQGPPPYQSGALTN